MAQPMPGGYHGKLLRVDLAGGTVRVEAITPLFCRQYLGGAGFIAYYLWRELGPGVDPLGPGNKLIFALGPVTGAALPGSGRHGVGARSPLTGGIALSEAGGFWGAELKRAGYDAIIIEGRAAQPVYLWVHDGEAALRDARHLWGQPTKETQQAIRDELGDPRVRVAGIGPAGEKQVRFACIMHGLFDAAGRGGLGAVMGAKNLKAVVVRGRQPPPVASPERVKALRQWVLDNMANKKLLASFHDYGTGAAMAGFEKSGNLPVRNFRDGLFPQVTSTDARTLRDTMGVGMDGCFACPVRCKKRVSSPEPYPVDAAYGGPEYETLVVLGANCGVDDLKAIARGNQLCGANGLDTISTGSVIAWAMECFERGLLTTRDTGGLKLEFGNGESMLALIELIARREGIGDRLAEGTARAARQLGPEALALTVQVKGLDAGMHDPRFKPGLGLGYMVNPHGADHCCNLHDTDYVIEGQVAELKPLGILEPLPREDIGPAKVALFKAVQAKYAVLDCLVVCRFLSYSFQQIAEIIGAVTGWDTSPAEQQRVAERVLTVARLFNLREGFTAADDELPPRFYQPKTDGALADKALDPEQMRQARRYYYTLMGWDADTGVPTPEKRAELGLG